MKGSDDEETTEVEGRPSPSGRPSRIEEVDEDEEDPQGESEEEVADVVKEALILPKPKRTSIISEATLRRMSSTQQPYGGYSAVRRARRRTATTQDHAKMCAMVQTKLKLGDIM